MEYGFLLAHLCHTSPAEVRMLTLAEFAVLLDGIDAEVARRAKGAA
jgi:hypothetical protein